MKSVASILLLMTQVTAARAEKDDRPPTLGETLAASQRLQEAERKVAAGKALLYTALANAVLVPLFGVIYAAAPHRSGGEVQAIAGVTGMALSASACGLFTIIGGAIYGAGSAQRERARHPTRASFSLNATSVSATF